MSSSAQVDSEHQLADPVVLGTGTARQEVTDVLDLFSAYFPLPYRVIATVTIGVWGWTSVLYVLNRHNINVEYLLRFNFQPGSAAPLYRSAYQIATMLTTVYGICTGFMWLISIFGKSLIFFGFDVLPFLCLIVLPVLIFYTGHQGHHRAARYRLFQTFRRISLGGLGHETRFADTIAADVLTSYSKVLADVWIMICMLLCGRSVAGIPDRTCGGEWTIPMIISVPYLIRLRQCLTDYVRSNYNRSHLLNAAKYATTFPVIILSVAKHKFDESFGAAYLGAITISNLWVLSMLINSLFSFYWDVSRDWDLSIFQLSRDSKNEVSRSGLREITYFPKQFYYLAIAFDFGLRFTWSLKLSPHLYFFNDFEGGVFVLEVMELFRRWIWLFLRIETEWIRSTKTGKPGNVMSDVRNA
ncbi:EXS family-domain-containing protein [Lipomyces oligophaga]|uniref:EXS family-domain-containing protein n=1 Tax=Lipomyces oligophaga TaxID=45792 RepID=UPI0034CD39E2